MSNPIVVVLVALLVVALIYLLISLGVFGGAGRIGRARADADADTRDTEPGSDRT